jgi:hypothetical protein
MLFDETQSVANTAQPPLGRGARINHFDPAANGPRRSPWYVGFSAFSFYIAPEIAVAFSLTSVAHAMILSQYEITAFGVPMLLSLHGICRR